jgi:putative aminopeptidase FrvX
MSLRESLREMTLLPGLAGHERRVAQYLAAKLKPLVDRLELDSAGNLIASIEGSDPGAPACMVFAHMDSLGFVVRRIERNGLVRFERLGGIPEKVLPGLRVVIETDSGAIKPGVIGVKAHHATAPEEKNKVIPYGELHIDVGCSSAEEVRALGIDVGCPIVYQPEFTELHGDRVAATAVDDRAGCAVLLELARRSAGGRPPGKLHLVGSVQEEYNLRGAVLAAERLKPDLAICLDLVIATDTPDLEQRGELLLGKGPTMSLYSFHGRGTLNGTLPHPALVRHFRQVAAAHSIPIQRSANLGSLTDSAYVQLVGTGIPSIDLGYPVRYTHTPVETCDLADLEQLTDLVWRGLMGIESGFDLARHDLTV